MRCTSGPALKPAAGFSGAARHLPFARQVVDVAQDDDDAVHGAGGIAVLAHAIDQIGDRFGLDLVERERAELRQNMDAQHRLVGLPAGLVAAHIRQIALGTKSRAAGPPASRAASAADPRRAALPPRSASPCGAPDRARGRRPVRSCTAARGRVRRCSADNRFCRRTAGLRAGTRAATRRNSRSSSGPERRPPVAQSRRTKKQLAFTRLPNASLSAPRKRRVVRLWRITTSEPLDVCVKAQLLARKILIYDLLRLACYLLLVAVITYLLGVIF